MNPSKCYIKELTIGQSLPLRLRFVINKGIFGHTSTVKNLTKVLFDRVNTPQIVRFSIDKENCKQEKNA
jgi:hypothetical protein